MRMIRKSSQVSWRIVFVLVVAKLMPRKCSP